MQENPEIKKIIEHAVKISQDFKEERNHPKVNSFYNYF
jgi:hypothetical protein